MKSRPSPREYHWGLVITNDSGQPVLHHATNLAGPWKYEERQVQSAIDPSLIVLVKASGVSNVLRATQIIQSVPADGKPSRRTGNAFTCRTWAKDTLVELHDKGEISLPNDIGASARAPNGTALMLTHGTDMIETQAIGYAERYAADSQQGKGAAVINGAFASSP
ncbi:hypothetical protein FGADI_9460 [Fusarium gaditjirri]|uniref:Uncharacterized protein n=1 Tax=Fusarium gaditjirri TaxID=282569 RepID=A0A8H4SZS4_9HYPO|nr:hypothetical protein FGADI_9460 [Fusarium gaditjirri]